MSVLEAAVAGGIGSLFEGMLTPDTQTSATRPEGFTGTLGLGDVGYDAGTGAFSANLSDQYKNLRNQQLGLSSNFSNALTAFNPQQAALDQYGLMQQYYKPTQDQQRLALENRLYQQGRLGSTGGGIQEEALARSFQQQDLQNQLAAWQQAQQAQAQLSALGTQALASGLSLDRASLEALASIGALGGRTSTVGVDGGGLDVNIPNLPEQIRDSVTGLGVALDPSQNTPMTGGDYATAMSLDPTGTLAQAGAFSDLVAQGIPYLGDALGGGVNSGLLLDMAIPNQNMIGTTTASTVDATRNLVRNIGDILGTTNTSPSISGTALNPAGAFTTGNTATDWVVNPVGSLANAVSGWF